MKEAEKRQYGTLWAKKIPKSAVYDFWLEFQKDKLNKILFYDGEMPDFEAFYAWLTAKDKDARFIVRGGCAENGGCAQGLDFLALYWLNNPLGKAVMIHFCFLRRAFCEQEEIGLYTVKSLLLCRQNGEYVVSALLGMTPKPYRHALAFIRKLGFRIAGEVPQACFFARQNKCKDAVFSMLTREFLPKDIL